MVIVKFCTLTSVHCSLQISPIRAPVSNATIRNVANRGPEAFSYGYFAFVSKGKLDQSDVAKMIITQARYPLNRLCNSVKCYLNILSRYKNTLT